ncbi:unnamed protein product [Rotaria sp. Silwood1]|nr:unnamed protein product [Rotaria sp. Silwood1]
MCFLFCASTVTQFEHLMHDDNTAFAVEPYIPPIRILRCYNCQVYDDHIAAHCPNKDNPVCFRCAQHHPYNPNCNNVIKCAHCQGDHMANDGAGDKTSPHERTTSSRDIYQITTYES